MALQSKPKENLPAKGGLRGPVNMSGYVLCCKGVCDVLARIGLLGQCIRALYTYRVFYSVKGATSECRGQGTVVVLNSLPTSKQSYDASVTSSLGESGVM